MADLFPNFLLRVSSTVVATLAYLAISTVSASYPEAHGNSTVLNSQRINLVGFHECLGFSL